MHANVSRLFLLFKSVGWIRIILGIRIRIQIRICLIVKPNPDHNPHASQKPDPKPHQSHKSGAVEVQNGAVEGPWTLKMEA